MEIHQFHPSYFIASSGSVRCRISIAVPVFLGQAPCSSGVWITGLRWCEYRGTSIAYVILARVENSGGMPEELAFINLCRIRRSLCANNMILSVLRRSIHQQEVRMKFTNFSGTKYEFTVGLVDGMIVLQASFVENGKHQTIWTADCDRLPIDEDEAREMLDGLDWNELDE